MQANIRALLGYEIHYRQISKEIFEARSLTKYGSRDACGGDEWTVIDQKPSASTIEDGKLTYPEESFFITVDPYSYYALFITTMLLREYQVELRVARLAKVSEFYQLW